MSHSLSGSAIEAIALGLIDRTLPKPEWTHTAHFAAAFWLLRRNRSEAYSRMPGLIRAYNEVTGVPNTETSGYHETITLASLRAADDWLAKRSAVALDVALAEFLSAGFGRSDWLLVYWSKLLLFSCVARRSWVEPDLRPLPF